jgi:hypothetical protein
MAEDANPSVAGSTLHFTVGSIRHTSGRSGGVDFRGELGLLKAALLYGDRVELVSVGASFMASLDELGNLPTPAKLALMGHIMPIVQPDATDQELNNVNLLINSMIGKLKRHRRLSKDEVQLLAFLKEKWRAIEDLVEEQFEKWGAEDFRVAQRSGLLDLRPFAATLPEKLLEMGMATGRRATDPERRTGICLGRIRRTKTWPRVCVIWVEDRAVYRGHTAKAPEMNRNRRVGSTTAEGECCPSDTLELESR